jgi:Fe-S oxidoreductase
MNKLIDKNIVECIRTTGKTSPELPDRIPILEKYNLPYDQPAENVLVSGCQVLPASPHLVAPLARLFDRKGLSYTMLSTEYCCGNYLYRPAIAARNEDAMNECRELSREFVGRNMEQAERLGAKRLIIFCSPCYPIYKHTFPEADIVFYPAMINELMDTIEYQDNIDYYAGCYRLHRKFSPVPMDLKSTDEVFDKIKGLEINRISAPKCCFNPDGLSHMINNISTKTMVHICTGCYGQAVQNLPQENETRVMMLPEFVEQILQR